VLDQLGDGSYMRCRTVPVFPQVGDKINRAIEAIATKQMSAEAALKQAQEQAIEAIRMGGYKVDL
jgi:multiple sugar transport system substrate-binding protein